VTVAPWVHRPRDERDAPGTLAVLDRCVLAHDLRQSVFPAPQSAGCARRIGAEVEVIPVDGRSGRPLPLETRAGVSSLSILRRAGADVGWYERR